VGEEVDKCGCDNDASAKLFYDGEGDMAGGEAGKTAEKERKEYGNSGSAQDDKDTANAEGDVVGPITAGTGVGGGGGGFGGGPTGAVLDTGVEVAILPRCGFLRSCFVFVVVMALLGVAILVGVLRG
jgi:hypothetical protein